MSSSRPLLDHVQHVPHHIHHIINVEDAGSVTKTHEPIGTHSILPTPESISLITNDDGMANDPKMRVALSYKSRHTSFYNIHLFHNIGDNAVDTSTNAKGNLQLCWPVWLPGVLVQ